MRVFPRFVTIRLSFLALSLFAFTIRLAFAQTCEPLPAGNVSWWPGDCHAGDIQVSNPGTFVNGATLGPGLAAQGFSLDGVDDYVSVGDRSSLDFGASVDFTIEAWIRSPGASVLQNIVDKRAPTGSLGYLVSLTPAGNVEVWVADNASTVTFLSSASGLDDDSFHHVAVVFDRDAAITMYVDGIQDASRSMSAIGGISNAGAFIIGRGNVNIPLSAHRAFRGTIDELRVFSRALAPSEIQGIVAASSAGVCKRADLGNPVVPAGFEVSRFVENGDPCRDLFHLSFDSNGILYSGGAKAGDPTGALPVLRISADGSTLTPYGPALADPDGVVVDEGGAVALAGPNTLLVGSGEQIVQIDPNSLAATSLFTVAGGSIQQMAFDNAGRLYFTDASNAGRVGRVENGTLSILNSLGVGIGGIALDEANNRMFVSAYLQGTVKVLDANGALLNGAFVTGLSQPDALALDTQGAFGNDLYVADRTSGVIVRVDPDTGANEVFAANLAFPIGMTFDSSGHLYVADEGGVWRIAALSGSVSGSVVADCPEPGTGLLGVTVDLFEVGTGALVASVVTQADGSYEIADLPPGDYTVTVVTPLSYTVPQTDAMIALSGGESEVVGFSLTCTSTPSSPRGTGFWKHQVGVATGGNGSAQMSGATLCSYLDLIEAHFNNNAVNEVAVYVAPASGNCGDKLLAAKELLNLRGNVGALAQAKQQLTAVLLNVAAGYLGLTYVISADGATVSQAITYCDNLIDDPAGDHARARAVAEYINGGGTVPSGMIPITTAQIAYRVGMEAESFRALPIAGSAGHRFEFATAAPGPVKLVLYDVSGRQAATVFQGTMLGGAHSVRWNGKGIAGKPVARGIYFARLETPREKATVKVLSLTK